MHNLDVITTKDYSKQFVKTIEKLDCRKRTYEKFDDFCQMAFYALANSVYKSNELEQKYMKIVDKYNREDASKMAQLLGIVVMALEQNPEQDFLGQMYMELEIGNPKSGQYFTPYHLARIMCKVNCQGIDEIIAQKGHATCLEPACGSGVMIIALRNQMTSQGYGTDNLLVQCINVDFLCMCIAYIQLSLLGVAGLVIHGYSLSNQHFSAWFTVPWFASKFARIYQGEQIWKTIKSLMQDEPIIDDKSSELEHPQQLSLFNTADA